MLKRCKYLFRLGFYFIIIIIIIKILSYYKKIITIFKYLKIMKMVQDYNDADFLRFNFFIIKILSYY